MGTDATGAPRRAPLPPSARAAGTTVLGSRAGRRPSNRPPPKSLFDAAPGTPGRDTGASVPRPGSAVSSAFAASATSAASAASPLVTRAAESSSAVRDELVRAVMPELRVLMEHLVKTNVERSLASLLEKQRELEAAIKTSSAPSAAAPAAAVQREVEAAVQRAVVPLLEKQRELEAVIGEMRRAGLQAAAAPSVVAPRGVEPAMPRGNLDAAPRAPVAPSWPILPPVSVTPRHAAAEHRAPAPRTVSTAYDADGALDIPAALNGSRRKRAVIWLLAVGVVLLLATVAGLAALSHTGKYL